MSSIKLHFEIGHSAERKAKPSKHGFTHDWELFVKSPNDSNDISQFIEKVVFNLHDSFPKPKRVIKDPPYVVKESGYAGFELTIDIYLRNRDEPKKITFPYDLDLQPFKSEVKEFIVNNPSDDFKRKCIKAGCQVVAGSSDYKNKDYKPSSSSASQEIKKPKRPEDKTKSYFTELFGDPIEKTSAKVVVNKKEEKLPPPPQPSSSSHKDKEKSKHKHSPVVDSKDSKSKKSDDRKEGSTDKPKKDKSRDRDRSEKKEKSAKRALSPPPVSSSSRPPSSSQPAPSKPPQDYQKSSQLKQPQPVVEQPAPQPTSTSTKKSNKKKNYEKDREKKESKKNVEIPVAKKPTKEEPSSKFDSRDKNFKSKPSTSEVKAPPEVKKHENVEVERKHKHKKKEKSKEKEKKEKPAKSQPQPAPAPVRTQTPVSSKSTTKFEKPPPVSDNSSDSEIESTPIKQEEPVVEFKAQPEPERHHTKNPREKPQKSNEKEDKKRKRAAEKEERDSSASPPPAKSNKKEPSPSPTSNASSKSTNNNNKQPDTPSDLKVTTEYLDELKDLKHKITTLKNNDHLQHVVRLIASTGCYEITKSTFDFDLVQLDKSTVQRLQEFFAN
ncbi:hypothetical protein ACKWTF_014133 [Chironomus riparius]